MKKRARRFIAYHPRPALQHNGLGLESMEAWPAAGGGLLIGIAEPALAGGAPLRPRVKSMFIRIDTCAGIAVLLPYVRLEAEARECIRALIAEELSAPEFRIAISDQGGAPAVVDVGGDTERSFRACAAVARTLLISAAAELWNLSTELCEAVQGLVHGPARAAGYGDIAADAALSEMPDCVQLRCGREVLVSPATRLVQDAFAWAD
jgi:hypothetical protein